MHLNAVRSILDRYGLDESDLGNTPTRPSGAAPRAAARAAGIEPSSIQQNCSGKHAAMLATCCVNGWPTDGYLDEVHTLRDLYGADQVSMITQHLATMRGRLQATHLTAHIATKALLTDVQVSRYGELRGYR